MNWYNKKLLFGVFLVLACLITIIIVLNTSPGWIETGMYQIYTSGGRIKYGDKLATLYAGLKAYSVDYQGYLYHGDLPDPDVLTKFGELAWVGSKYIIGF